MNVASFYKPRKLRRVFVWEMPVRVYHWINALSIAILVATGLIIGNPPAIMTGREAYAHYWFGTTRFIHFAAAYIFLFNYLFRIYWGFVGNKYASWKNFIPTNRKYFREIWNILKSDVFMTKGYNIHTIGHNRLAGFIYLLSFIAFGIQCLTGFGLYSAMSDWWLPDMFVWVPYLFGGDFFIRLLHHWTTWFFILFTLVHVYLVFYHDYIEGHGEMSSIAGGWNFIEEDVFQEHHPEEVKKNDPEEETKK